MLPDFDARAQAAFTDAQYELWNRLNEEFSWAEAESAAGGPKRKSLLWGLIKRGLENKLLEKSVRGLYIKLKPETLETSELPEVRH